MSASDKPKWSSAIERMRARIDQTLDELHSGFPHWADAKSGKWTTTIDGDWTGGAWPGMLWLAARRTGEARYRDAARLWSSRLGPRARLQTAFKGFGFYYGVALGDVLCNDRDSVTLALEAAESLKGQFDRRLGLIPLGSDAEGSEDVGNSFSSIEFPASRAAAVLGCRQDRRCVVCRMRRVSCHPGSRHSHASRRFDRAVEPIEPE